MSIEVRESLRLLHKPTPVRWLFVGESPPAGETFFYTADSNLFRYTRQAFSAAYEIDFNNGPEFLTFFQQQGCYLIDLCEEPVNNLPKSEREDRRRLGAAELLTRIANLAPRAVIVVMKAIFKYIRPAAKLAGLPELPLYALSFPAMGNQQRYVATLTDILKQLRKSS